MTPELRFQAQLDALTISGVCSSRARSLLLRLGETSPQAAADLLAVLHHIPGGDIEQQLICVGRIGIMRARGVEHGHVPSVIGAAADGMPVWVLRQTLDWAHGF